MKFIDKIRKNLATINFNSLYNKYFKSGDIKPFDDEFLSRFDGKYYHGLPIYYYLTDYMSNGRCYDASIVLFLAMGEGTYLCRGELQSQIGTWTRGTGHGWVETDDMVYDTTWQIMCKKEIYYKVFKTKLNTRKDYKTAEKGLRNITDTSIHDKEWYEQNFGNHNILIFQVREIEKLKLNSKLTSEKEKAFARKVLNDLPNTRLCYFEDITEMDLNDNIFSK